MTVVAPRGEKGNQSVNAPRLLASALVCFATVATAAATASASTSSAPPSVTISATPTLGAPPSVSPQVVANNTAFTFCTLAPGFNCNVEYLMTRGTAEALFVFSNGEEAEAPYVCARAVCTVTATGYPNSPTVSADGASITGPNISIIEVYDSPEF